MSHPVHIICDNSEPR